MWRKREKGNKNRENGGNYEKDMKNEERRKWEQKGAENSISYFTDWW